MTRPGASLRVRQALEVGAPGFAAVQGAVTAYLDAEQRRGRLADGTDIATVALALVGTVHHLLMSSWAGAEDAQEQTRRLVMLLVGEGGKGPS
ncbi:hypothetical protein [Streptomyces halobius]|uniref:TetR family transcriptional regulator n=1 Tax=Streptomyces halobius TaxID=2879846 RepID=A0ABY4MHR4_9ACTN|nr:hypothetical protein [Streptomyces halobius]UQA97283.1 hypothetical protein K9S39_40330 [Streptomyces halobius]